MIGMKPALVGSIALVLVAAVSGLACPTRSSAQSGAPWSFARDWPPDAEDMVTVTDSSVNLSPGASHVVFRVPADRWLVLTEIATAQMGNPSPFFRVEERAPGSTLTKLPDFFMPLWTHNGVLSTQFAHVSTGGVGIAFKPGSHVVITQPAGTSSFVGAVTVIGYLSRR
jgi:hypothetical protein